VTRFGTGRVVAWFVVVGALAAGNYVVRFTDTAGRGDRDSLYLYSSALSGLLFYGVFFAFVYAIAAVDTEDLFALRRPESWHDAAALCLALVVGIYVWSFVISRLPLPESPSTEQGLTPTHWDPKYAGPYAANFVVIALVAPVIEELTFRGVGFRLLEPYGRVLAIVVVGITFGLAHGLVEGLLVLVPFGAGLAYVRMRTDSVYPGMIVHGFFNSVALLYVLTT